MSGLKKGLGKVEVGLKWDPSPLGEPPHDLDLVAATYSADDPHGSPEYLVHFDSRSPDGTINLNRDSQTGQGFGFDEVMTLEFDRLSESYARVVVGVVIQQKDQPTSFGDVENTGVRIREDALELLTDDFASVSGAIAATVAEFVRDDSGAWDIRPAVRGFDTDLASFAQTMGSAPS